MCVYSQPLIILVFGLAILSFVGYMNWYGDIKMKSVRWITKTIFKGKFRSDISADNLFMNLTAIVLVFGLMWVALGLGYLFN
jgi:hypothetical protein